MSIQSNHRWSSLAMVFTLSLNFPIHAAESVSLQKMSFAALRQQFQLSLPGIRDNTAEARERLQFISEHKDNNAITHVRMQQYYAGVLVFGGYAMLHSSQNANSLATEENIYPSKLSMNGVVYRSLDIELGKPETVYQANASLALARFKEKYAGYPVTEEQVLPIIYIDDAQHAHWAYQISLLVQYPNKIPERPTALLDAKTYKPFVQWNAIKTSKKAPVKGIGFGGNHKIGEYEYGKDYPFLDLMRDTQSEQCFMENEQVKVIDMGHRYSSASNPMHFACSKVSSPQVDTFYTGYEADGYDTKNGAASPTNDALYAAHVIKHLYRDWFNVDVLTKEDGSPMQLLMRVHYGEGYENAFWDGTKMTFGDGKDTMYPLVSLGIAAHEISHGFTEQQSGLHYFGQSGGMNESFSDMAAQAAEYYALGKNSWKIGYEIIKEGGRYDALRYMDKPSRDGRSIDTATAYRNGLNVHYTSGVYNRLFYLLSNHPGWTTRKAFAVMVKANRDYWTPYSNFENGACGVLAAAKDLGFSIEEVKESLTAVAINYQSCS